MEQDNKKKKNKLWILFIVIPILTLGIAFLGFSYFTQSFIFKETPRPVDTGYTFPMEEMVINLKEGSRYLKTEIVLGYGMEEDVNEIQEKKFQLRDSIIGILRNKSRDEIMPVETTRPLKDEIKKELNQHFQEAVITDIYITEFIIQ